MELNTYQREAGKTAVYPDIGANLEYTLISLAGEVGSLCNKFKKKLRGDVNPPSFQALADELGDVLWYVQQTATELGYDLTVIAAMNLKKLADRKERDVIKGTGSNR